MDGNRGMGRGVWTRSGGPILVLTMAFIVVLSGAAWAATILRVDSVNIGGGDGSDWGVKALNEDQFRKILKAVTLASGDVEFWVAKGVYRPSGSDPNESFVLLNNVALCGGFNGDGTETNSADRDPSVNVTVLTGDIYGDDIHDAHGATVSADHIMGTNSLHVIMSTGCDSTAILDGFTICAGSGEYGGGMHNESSNPTVIDCTFLGSMASDSGGGMSNRVNSDAVVTNCTFSGNAARWGGGMYNEDSNPTVINCTFSGDVARWGGGMYSKESSPTVMSCTFLGNVASQEGGGMNNSNSNSFVSNCTFLRNVAEQKHGGGMYSNDSNPTVMNCTFSGNEASQDGGGMYNCWESSPSVINCTFSRNVAGNDGGGMFNDGKHDGWESSPSVINCTFSGNVAGNDGGGVVNWDRSSPIVTNCTFSGNVASENGGGILNSGDSSPTVTNCIFWDNVNGDLYNGGTSTSVVSYSVVEDGTSGTGNIDADPLLSALANNGGPTWTMEIGKDSPARNAGIGGSGIPATDQRGEPRDWKPDMGAYEEFDTSLLMPPGTGPGIGGPGGSCPGLHILSTIVIPEGAGSITPTNPTVSNGVTVDLSITAHAGYVLDDVKIDGESRGAVETLRVKVTKAHVVEALFSPVSTSPPSHAHEYRSSGGGCAIGLSPASLLLALPLVFLRR
ncbi:MAG: hypothetical protein CSA35_03165 [Dethiosulfovibrio peptidovorans]|nr:MAG: hypothetical protein CSA35_03165 [Dethiosulfovibrio peptidovorans]